MTILADARTIVLSQGLTGRQATFYAERALSYGTRLAAGVRPGKGGRRHLGLPVYDSVREAVEACGATASIVFVPPAAAADAMIEAIEAGLELVVCVTERVPVHDMVRVRAALAGSRTRLVGPNSAGVLVPGACLLGVMSTKEAVPGRIGVVSRSASLTSEVVALLRKGGFGQSTIVGIGGDVLYGVGFTDCLELFARDPGTDAVVMIGEIGGVGEEEAASWLAANPQAKPVVGLVVGRHAPAARRMGHAGTLTSIGSAGVEDKVRRLAQAGVHMARDVDDVVARLRAAIAGKAGT